MIADLVKKTRSYRRFNENRKITMASLKQLVDLGRLSASAANRQPLKYILSCDPATNDKIFPCIGWAAYLKDWKGPEKGERPAAYIIMLGDTTISSEFWCDHGISGQSILLGATEMGLGGCFIGAINKDKLCETLNLSPELKIMLIIALGEPAEEVVIESTADTNGNIRYWRDENGTHHVPKRPLDEIIIDIFSG
ncbi:MAG: nitroreductase family protein [Desulfobacteraceae bacterium]|nr:nitroreductase family protein [Desulfobacteraceae bacterium]MBC2757689.1 nitroreductase family protein [Desulfobacteraceae bacterium]